MITTDKALYSNWNNKPRAIINRQAISQRIQHVSDREVNPDLMGNISTGAFDFQTEQTTLPGWLLQFWLIR